MEGDYKMEKSKNKFIEALCQCPTVNGNALKIALVLMGQNFTQKEMCDKYNYKKAAVSMSIQKLLSMGIVEKRQVHNSDVYYSNLSWRDKGLKILGWNINQRLGTGGKIPHFVATEIINKTPDIVVITEFFRGEGWEELKSTLEEEGYKLYYEKTPIKKKNEVLIAIKERKNLIIAQEAVTETVLGKNKKPNFLQVGIEYNNKPLTVIGVRILPDGDYQKRKEQLDSLTDYVKGKKNILIIGDFNNSKICGNETLSYEEVREEYHLTKRKEVSLLYDTYNYHILKDQFKHEGFTIATPTGNVCSWVDKYKNEYKLDHIFAKELNVHNAQYKWDFISQKNGHGTLKSDDYKSENAGVPDHAILTAVIEFKE